MPEYLDTGLSLLNLSCSGNVNGGFKLGKCVNIVGDSSSGKTYLCLTALACAAHNKEFDDYELYLDDVESANEFDVRNLFGSSSAERIKSPYEEGKSSETIEEFYFTIGRLLDEARPFIYVLDSMDALSSTAEIEKFEENREKYEKGKETKGSYGDGKAKVNSANLRQIVSRLQSTKSLLIIISQTRDNITSTFAQKTRSGGRALEFYCSYVMWLAKLSKITKKVNGKDRSIGSQSRLKLTKNKVTGKYHEIDFPILYQYGIDDTDSMINYLLEEKALKKSGAYIEWEGKNYHMVDLVNHIESTGIDKVKELVSSTWNGIEDQLKTGRERFE